jgi:chaperonin GroEL
MRNVLKVTACKAPGFGDNRKAMLQDMAVLTGATLVSDDTGIKMETIGIESLGRIKKVEQTKDDTVLTVRAPRRRTCPTNPGARRPRSHNS